MTHPKPPPSVKPWPCVILAVDTASNSGWAIYRNGELLDSGEQSTTDALAYIDVSHQCRAALEYCDERDCSEGVLVLERPWGGGWKAAAGLAIAAKMWRDGWANAGGSERRIVRVYPQTWRSSVLAVTRGPMLKLHEREFARRVKNSSAVGPDEAAAICIGRWACHAGEVGKVLPAKLRKAVGA